LWVLDCASTCVLHIYTCCIHLLWLSNGPGVLSAPLLPLLPLPIILQTFPLTAVPCRAAGRE
jgi:hypothetical protein